MKRVKEITITINDWNNRFQFTFYSLKSCLEWINNQEWEKLTHIYFPPAHDLDIFVLNKFITKMPFRASYGVDGYTLVF